MRYLLALGVGIVVGSLVTADFARQQIEQRDELIAELLEDTHRCNGEVRGDETALLHILGFKDASYLHVEVRP